jgi:hypothetical protein
MLAAWQAKGGDPPSQLIAACRECRFLAEERAALAAGDSRDTEGDVIFVALDAAVFGGEKFDNASESDDGHGSPAVILRSLWAAPARSGAVR